MITGAGLGGLKACVPPFMGSFLVLQRTFQRKPADNLIADQYTETKLRVKTINNGERVILDRSLTLRSIYGLWYWCVNVGSLSGIATTFMERDISFWAAYLLPACFLWIAVILLIVGRKRFGKQTKLISPHKYEVKAKHSTQPDDILLALYCSMHSRFFLLLSRGVSRWNIQTRIICKPIMEERSDGHLPLWMSSS